MSFMAAYWIRFNIEIIPVTKGVPPVEHYIKAMPIVMVIFLGAFKWSGLFEEHKIIYKTDEFLKILKGVAVSFVIITAATFVYREFEYSRLVLGYAFILNIFLIFSVHRILRLFRVKLILPISEKIGILVIGGQKVKQTLLNNISRKKEFDVRFLPEIDFSKIKNVIKKNNISEVILVKTDVNKDDVFELINICEYNDIEFKMVPDMVELKMGEMGFDRFFGIPVLQLKHPLHEPANYYVKRIFDIIGSMCILVLIFPVIIFLMIAIAIDSRGPVIYVHLRKGFKGKSFPFFKFRSMVRDADDKLKELIKHNERGGPVFKMKNDPRITKIGRVIRKYSLDELPQFFNVLRGDMSIVGPRPQVLWEAEAYDEEAKRRLNILPGITGLWQISGRSELSYEEMIRLDLYYLENWTPGLDLRIILRTIPMVLFRKGAY